MFQRYRKYCLLLLFLPVMTAWGQENYQVRSIEIAGNEVMETDLLKEQMNTRAMNTREHVFFWKKTPHFSEIILENDIDRLKRFYQRNGFLKPEIMRELEVDQKKEQVRIHIKVDEGSPVILKEIRYSEINRKQSTGVLEKAKGQVALKEGSRFKDRDIYEAMEVLKQAYKNRGYPFVQLTRNIQVNPGELTATLRFQVAPGPKASLGEVEFQGDSLVPESFIRKKLTFSSGDVYSQEKLERSQEEIFETGLFQYAIIRAQKDSLIKNRLPVLVRVKEQPQWGFEGGVGYGTEDRFRLSAELIKRHFMGGARRLILEAKRSYYLPVSLDARFIQPDVFNQELDLVLNPFFLREREESYEVDRLGAGLTLQKKFSRSLSTFLTYTLERDNLLDKTLPDSISQKAVHNKSGLTLGINKNSTDNIFEPTKGWRLEGYMTLMGLGFRSRYDYLKFDLEARHYEQISPDYILAGKLGVGLIQPFKEDQATPIEDRFLIGGASSLRGWSRNTISPQDENGKAVGGNSMLEASLELRFPVYDIVSGTLFADAGNVWANAMYFDLGNLYYDAGVGIRVQTPIGPIRMDVAFPLTEEAFRSQFYISLGHAF